MPLPTCNRCGIGKPKFFKYADGDGLIWTDSKGLPYYVYICNHCGAEHRIPVSRQWDADNPDIQHQVGNSGYNRKKLEAGMAPNSAGIWVPVN